MTDDAELEARCARNAAAARERAVPDDAEARQWWTVQREGELPFDVFLGTEVQAAAQAHYPDARVEPRWPVREVVKRRW